jgi:hypothetical protein
MAKRKTNFKKASYSTVGELRQQWLFQLQNVVVPDTLEEFLSKTLSIMDMWYERWHTLYEKVDPKAFSSDQQRADFLRENDWKALAVWHAMREVRVYWQEAGVWDGNPYDPSDKGSFKLK